MAYYTAELGEIVKSGMDIFDFTYPIYDETHRAALEQRIIDTYYFHEIGFETVGRFKQRLEARLNAIMPGLNTAYAASVGREIAIFQNSKHTVSHAGTDETTVTNDLTNTGEDTTTNNLTNQNTETPNTTVSSKKLHSDTAMGRITLTDTENVSAIDDDTQTTSGSVQNNETRTGTVKLDTSIRNTGTVKTDRVNGITDTDAGYSGTTEAELMQIYLRNQYNIDNEVIKGLADLFMCVYRPIM